MVIEKGILTKYTKKAVMFKNFFEIKIEKHFQKVHESHQYLKCESSAYVVHNEYFLGGKENHNFILDIQKYEEFKCRP